MRLIIELLTRDAGTGDARDDTHYAIARYEGMLVSKAGVGSGSERGAAQEAINSFYARQQAERDTPPPIIYRSFPDEGVMPCPTGPLVEAKDRIKESILDVRIETTERGVLALLREALAFSTKPRLTLHYENAQGMASKREIIPLEIEDANAPTFPVPTYLKAIDCGNDEPRTFRLDRITKLETV